MPKTCEFYGVVIAMYYNDHEPSHFHAIYSGSQAVTGIDPISILQGRKMEVVTKIEVLRPYALRVEFSDGAARDVDLEDELYGEVFEPLKDPDIFSKATVDQELGTVEWPNGADFSPEFLYHGAKTLANA